MITIVIVTAKLRTVIEIGALQALHARKWHTSEGP